LAIIKGYTNTLSRSDAHWDAATLRRSFEAIEEETDHMSQLMNRLLLASRLETGELPMNQEPVQLSALAEKVVSRMQATAKDRDFVVSFPEDLPAVSADAGLVEEVLVNLVDNAIKYSPSGGPIGLAGQVDGSGQVTLSVSDSGVGVPRWESRRVFERFFRSQDPVSAQTRGLGIGLYICDAVIRAHGGEISVESRPGGGSVFTISLPEYLEGQI
jgi:signal transduction histidine kinase